MPRVARLDIPGLLQHVIVRGIEGRDIFLDDHDRRTFSSRLSELLAKTQSECFAWALLPNHLHLLLRSNRVKLGVLMRRLLTGYAVRFNLRHSRAGHLFQNRYKSLVCEEEPYFLELVRYIHLNPLRAGIVSTLERLDTYPWSGHAVILGNGHLDGQNVQEVLSRFEGPIPVARRRYRAFLQGGVGQGRRDDLVGRGRPRGHESSTGSAPDSFDLRILGSRRFMEELRTSDELKLRLPEKMPLNELVQRVCRMCGVEPETVRQRKKNRRVAAARALVCYVAVRELGHTGVEVSRLLRISNSAVSVAAERGEVMVKSDEFLQNEVRNLTN